MNSDNANRGRMSKKLNLTPWFDGSAVKPCCIGVYMLLSDSNIGYQYWNGARWGSWATTPEIAVKLSRFAADAYFQNDKWRGLAQKS